MTTLNQFYLQVVQSKPFERQKKFHLVSDLYEPAEVKSTEIFKSFALMVVPLNTEAVLAKAERRIIVLAPTMAQQSPQAVNHHRMCATIAPFYAHGSRLNSTSHVWISLKLFLVLAKNQQSCEANNFWSGRNRDSPQ